MENNTAIILIRIKENENIVYVKCNSNYTVNSFNRSIKTITIQASGEGLYDTSVARESSLIDANLEIISDNSNKIKYLNVLKSELIYLIYESGYKDKLANSPTCKKGEKIVDVINNKLENARDILGTESLEKATKANTLSVVAIIVAVFSFMAALISIYIASCTHN